MGEKVKITKKELIEIFLEMFPQYDPKNNYFPHIRKAKKFKRMGSRTISIYFDDNSNAKFLYYSNINYSFTTKMWRNRPKRLKERMKDNEI